MTSTPKMARAAVVTRTLTAAGMPKSQDHASGMVRGWHTYTRGVRSEQVATHTPVRQRAGNYRDGSPRYTNRVEATPTGWVEVTWVFSSSNHTEDRAAVSIEQMAKATEILTGKGYTVEQHVRGTSGEVALRVCRQDADGNVVRF